jgi:hypothetical protein
VGGKTKCAPPLGALPPYDCASCIKAGRPCEREEAAPRPPRKVAGRKRARASQPAAVAGPSQLAGIRVDPVDVHATVTALFWRCERIRLVSQRASINSQLAFIDANYAEALGFVAAPVASDEPPVKRARLESSKGKGKARAPTPDDVIDLDEGSAAE